jgi:DNA-binding MarR family transcriptional regulator
MAKNAASKTQPIRKAESESHAIVDRRVPHLDRLIHERVRLGIISALAANESLSFNDLKRLLETTDGNVSVHARKLEEGDYIVCEKFFEGRMPKTIYRLTNAGRKAFEQYLQHMESVIAASRGK